jgi:hypothetical protein
MLFYSGTHTGTVPVGRAKYMFTFHTCPYLLPKPPENANTVKSLFCRPSRPIWDRIIDALMLSSTFQVAIAQTSTNTSRYRIESRVNTLEPEAILFDSVIGLCFIPSDPIMTIHTDEKETEFARKMLLRADAILEAVDQAYIIKERGHKVRAMPTFRPEEISLGETLGTGGFGIVNEIKGFFLDEEDKNEAELFQAQAQSEEDPNDEKSTLMTALIQNNPQGAADATLPSTGLRKRTSEPKVTDQRAALTTDTDEVAHESDAHIHYDVKEAKEVMATRAIKCGRGRYALKRLHNDLSELERSRGMIDLAVEAKYLSTVWHPNIST